MLCIPKLQPEWGKKSRFTWTSSPEIGCRQEDKKPCFSEGSLLCSLGGMAGSMLGSLTLGVPSAKRGSSGCGHHGAAWSQRWWCPSTPRTLGIKVSLPASFRCRWLPSVLEDGASKGAQERERQPIWGVGTAHMEVTKHIWCLPRSSTSPYLGLSQISSPSAPYPASLSYWIYMCFLKYSCLEHVTTFPHYVVLCLCLANLFSSLITQLKLPFLILVWLLLCFKPLCIFKNGSYFFTYLFEYSKHNYFEVF